MVSPFKTGNGLILESTIYTPETWYLEAFPTAGRSLSVSLSHNGLGLRPGVYWEVTALLNNRISLRTVDKSTARRYLDSSGAASPKDSVYLDENSKGSGSHWVPTQGHWTPTKVHAYTFRSDTPSGVNRFLDGSPRDDPNIKVTLVESAELQSTEWRILLTHCTGETVQSIISATYPSVPISSFEPKATYGSLEYDRLHSIWKNTELGNNQIMPHPNDFAVCLKTEIYKHSNNPDSPWPNDKGSLCGIMWGSIGGKMCAVNFTIDPFLKLILFDPQNGQEIATDKYTPTLCMV